MLHRQVMTPVGSPGGRTRRSPVAQCRICSAVVPVDASTTELLRHNLRRFMAEHRHDGLADIVIDITDDETDDPASDVLTGQTVSGS